MLYQEFPVAPELSPYILCYWKFTAPARLPEGAIRHYIMPDGCPSLIFFDLPQFMARGTSLLGPTKYISEATIFEGSVTVGIRWRPGSTQATFQRSSLSLRDQALRPAPPLANFSYSTALELMGDETSLFSYFDRQLPELLSGLQVQGHPEVKKAINCILQSKGNIRIAELLAKVHLSERQLQKVFKREVGLTLKEFATVMRLRAAVIQLELKGEDYQETVFNSGYFDQAHFIRDFSKLSRISLPDFKRYIRNIQHVGVVYRQ